MLLSVFQPLQLLPATAPAGRQTLLGLAQCDQTQQRVSNIQRQESYLEHFC